MLTRRWGAVPVIQVMRDEVIGPGVLYPEAARPVWTPIRGTTGPEAAMDVAVMQLMSVEFYCAPEMAV